MIAFFDHVRILVTGAAGFIGSHVAEALRADGHAVVGVDDLSTGRRANLPGDLPLHELDIRDPRTAELIATFRPEALVHHAAQADVRRSVADPVFDADVNVLGSLRLLEACRAAGCRRIVFASTGGAIYGEQERFPADETHPARPRSPYGCAKLAVEGYLTCYALEHGFEPVCLRYANVFGPRQNPHGEAGVVAIFAELLLRGRPVTIYGDGAQTRDFVHVSDVALANVLALRHGLTGAYNVGTGSETTINVIYERLQGIIGGQVPADHVPARPGEQRRSCVDATRLQAATPWHPRGSLEAGRATTVAHIREHAP